MSRIWLRRGADYADKGSPAREGVEGVSLRNITSKSDVGGYTYDTLHPHAVKSISGVASAVYGYDAVGNQTERPGVSGKITYNSFDLPTGYEAATGAVALTYDDAGHRVRKTTPEQDILSFGEIYERVTTAAGVEDRYYLRNAEGVFAVAHRGAAGPKEPEVRYVFTDHLGSTDVITDETGSVEHERQSFDAFGARRNATWGKPLPPGSEPPQTTAMGYTGHALDAEVGIVNAKGRLFDPKLGRFLQVDPLQTDLLNAQRWNSYSYALNNPLRYTDPSGFDGEEGPVADLPNVSIGPRWDVHGQLDPSHMVEWHCTADGYSACVGMTVPAQPGESGPAQAGSAAEEASSPPAAGALDVAAAYMEGLGPSLGSAAIGGVKQSVGMLLLPLTAPWEMTYGGVQRAQSLLRAYDRDGWSGVFWKAVASLPVLGSVSAALDAYREAYALPMSDPRDQARAAGQITVPVAVAAVGVVGATYGLAEGVGVARGPLKNASGALDDTAFKARTINPRPSAVNVNDLSHIFGQARHNLGPVVERFGSQHAAFEAIQNAAQASANAGSISGIFQTVVRAGGFDITVRGRVLDGVARVSTVFIP